MKKALVIFSIFSIVLFAGSSCTTLPKNAMSSKVMYQKMGKNNSKKLRVQKRKNKQLNAFTCPDVSKTWQHAKHRY